MTSAGAMILLELALLMKFQGQSPYRSLEVCGNIYQYLVSKFRYEIWYPNVIIPEFLTWSHYETQILSHSMCHRPHNETSQIKNLVWLISILDQKIGLMICHFWKNLTVTQFHPNNSRKRGFIWQSSPSEFLYLSMPQISVLFPLSFNLFIKEHKYHLTV